MSNTNNSVPSSHETSEFKMSKTKKEKVSYSIVKTTIKNAEPSKLTNLFNFSKNEIEVDQGDIIVFKRAKNRSHGELGYDYAGTIVSPALCKNFYQTKLNGQKSLVILLLLLILSALSTVSFTFLNHPFLWFNQEYATGNFFSDSILTIVFGYLMFTLIRTATTCVFVSNRARWKNIYNFWADVSFEIADAHNKNTAFKDLLIRWDYVEENFVNEAVANNFDKYIQQLDDKELLSIVKQGVVFSLFDESPEDAEDELRNELYREASEHGNRIKQLIIEEFQQSFEAKN